MYRAYSTWDERAESWKAEQDRRRDSSTWKEGVSGSLMCREAMDEVQRPGEEGKTPHRAEAFFSYYRDP